MGQAVELEVKHPMDLHKFAWWTSRWHHRGPSTVFITIACGGSLERWTLNCALRNVRPGCVDKDQRWSSTRLQWNSELWHRLSSLLTLHTLPLRPEVTVWVYRLWCAPCWLVNGWIPSCPTEQKLLQREFYQGVSVAGGGRGSLKPFRSWKWDRWTGLRLILQYLSSPAPDLWSSLILVDFVLAGRRAPRRSARPPNWSGPLVEDVLNLRVRGLSLDVFYDVMLDFPDSALFCF